MLKEQFEFINTEEANPFKADEMDIADASPAMLNIDEDEEGDEDVDIDIWSYILTFYLLRKKTFHSATQFIRFSYSEFLPTLMY